MLSDEEKEIFNNLKEYMQSNINKGYHKFIYNDLDWDFKCIDCINAIDKVLKQSKEIEELKEENLEIRDWKYVIDSPIDLDKLKELDLIKIKGKEYVSKDKIKSKIDYLLKHYDSENFINFEMFIKILQSLLEKE